MEEPNLRPVGRFGHPANKQEVTTSAQSAHKIKKYYVQSRNVYENNGNSDILPDEMSDIRVDTTWILRQIRICDGQFGLICAVRRLFCGHSRRIARLRTKGEESARRSHASASKLAPEVDGHGTTGEPEFTQ
jgi:hypothetical protein